jgi:hypothetical protein
LDGAAHLVDVRLPRSGPQPETAPEAPIAVDEFEDLGYQLIL